MRSSGQGRSNWEDGESRESRWHVARLAEERPGKGLRNAALMYSWGQQGEWHEQGWYSRCSWGRGPGAWCDRCGSPMHPGPWVCAGCELYAAIRTTLLTAERRAKWRRGMQNALRRYKARTRIWDEESDLETPRGWQWNSNTHRQRAQTTGCGRDDDTSAPHIVRWQKIWSTDQGAFYYWKEGSEVTQWEDPMDGPGRDNVTVRTWGAVEYETEERFCDEERRPRGSGSGSLEALQAVMDMTDSGEYTGEQTEDDRPGNSSPGRRTSWPEITGHLGDRGGGVDREGPEWPADGRSPHICSSHQTREWVAEEKRPELAQ